MGQRFAAGAFAGSFIYIFPFFLILNSCKILIDDTTDSFGIAFVANKLAIFVSPRVGFPKVAGHYVSILALGDNRK